MADFPVLRPDLQIAFALRLRQIEHEHLAEALRFAVQGLQVVDLDRELASLLKNERLARLASFGLRGETFFPCPAVLASDPRLLGYYRLLYGLSQKEFYRSGSFGKFKAMEERGVLSSAARRDIEELCRSLCETGWLLLEELPLVSVEFIRDLQLLTLGSQLRGSRLNEIGKAAVIRVFQRIREAIADSAVMEQSETTIRLRNAAGRVVTIAFASDPDIAVTERLNGSNREILAVEVKGGTDVSNIHNRLGEAEKSHQKARAKGFTEFWTIINATVDLNLARRESPTTDRFFYLEQILDPDNPEWLVFRDQLTSRLGVPASL